MIKICAGCGKPFDAKTVRANYCSKKCSDHWSRRYKQTREEQHQHTIDDKKKAIELFYSYKTTKEIAEEIGRSVSFITTAWNEADLGKRPTKFQMDVIRLRKQGLCCVEIADNLNKPSKYIIQTAKAVGMPFTEEEKQRSIVIGLEKSKIAQWGNVDERIDKQIAFLREHHPNWSYVSGWVSSDGFMELKCNQCGSIIKKSAVSIRHANKLLCQKCSEIKKEQREQQRQTKRILYNEKRAERFWNKFWLEEYTPATVKTCLYCGEAFVNRHGGCCSDVCSKKRTNQLQDRRIRRIYKRDKSITLQKLYTLQNGICWICGEKCDFDDCSVDINGNFIVGKWYPSIDHIYPLSKGGSHSWDNVALAHHYCNTLKSDKVVS